MTQRGPLEQRERLDFGVRVGLKAVGEVTSPPGSPCLVIRKAGTKATSKDSWEDFRCQCRPVPSLPHHMVLFHFLISTCGLLLYPGVQAQDCPSRLPQYPLCPAHSKLFFFLATPSAMWNFLDQG